MKIICNCISFSSSSYYIVLVYIFIQGFRDKLRFIFMWQHIVMYSSPRIVVSRWSERREELIQHMIKIMQDREQQFSICYVGQFRDCWIGLLNEVSGGATMGRGRSFDLPISLATCLASCLATCLIFSEILKVKHHQHRPNMSQTGCAVITLRVTTFMFF